MRVKIESGILRRNREMTQDRLFRMKPLARLCHP